MYPYLNDLILDLWGIRLPLPFPMFGFFVGLAFLVATHTLSLEVRRKAQEGFFSRINTDPAFGRAGTWLLRSVAGFWVGYKFPLIMFHFNEVISDPRQYVFSGAGSLPAGLSVVMLVLVYQKYMLNRRNTEKTVAWLQLPLNVQLDNAVSSLAGIALITGLAGAKLFHQLEGNNLKLFMADPFGALFSTGGFSMYGGLMMGGACVLIYARWRRIDLLPLADACAPGLMLGYGVGRIGCHVAGDGDWGVPNDSPQPAWLRFLPDWTWAYDYTNNILGVHLRDDFAAQGWVSVTGKAWPTPLYEAVISILLFIVLWKLRKRLSRPGMLFWLYLMLNGVERFWIEKIRVNPYYHVGSIAFTQAELLATILFLMGCIGLWYPGKKTPEAAQPVHR